MTQLEAFKKLKKEYSADIINHSTNKRQSNLSIREIHGTDYWGDKTEYWGIGKSSHKIDIGKFIHSTQIKQIENGEEFWVRISHFRIIKFYHI